METTTTGLRPVDLARLALVALRQLPNAEQISQEYGDVLGRLELIEQQLAKQGSRQLHGSKRAQRIDQARSLLRSGKRAAEVADLMAARHRVTLATAIGYVQAAANA